MATKEAVIIGLPQLRAKQSIADKNTLEELVRICEHGSVGDKEFITSISVFSFDGDFEREFEAAVESGYLETNPIKITEEGKERWWSVLSDLTDEELQLLNQVKKHYTD